MDFLIIFGENFSKSLPFFLSVAAPTSFVASLSVDYLLIKNPGKFNWLRRNNETAMREAASYEMQQAALGDFIPLAAARLKLGVILAVSVSFIESFLNSIQIVLSKI